MKQKYIHHFALILLFATQLFLAQHNTVHAIGLTGPHHEVPLEHGGSEGTDDVCHLCSLSNFFSHTLHTPSYFYAGLLIVFAVLAASQAARRVYEASAAYLSRAPPLVVV